MFCKKCGQQCSEDIKFCSQCGERIDAEERVDCDSDNSKKLSIEEYFEKECSDKATKRQKYLKAALWVSAVIQILLLILAGICLLPLFFLVPFYALSPLLILEIMGWVCGVGSILLAKKSIKKKNPGPMFASIIFAVFSICVGALAFNIQIVTRILVVFIAAWHIAMFVLNRKDVKEYKEYLIK